MSESELTMQRGKAENVGWCNGCTDRPPYGGDVRVIRFRAMEARVCPRCAVKLVALLNGKKEPQ
jgi:hypothetical protein